MAIDNRIVSSNISKLRNNRGMTQFQLAAALNVSHQAVSKWETGQALPDIQTLLSLTQLFGVTMEELLNTEIVIREEEEPAMEEPEEESAGSIFPGFLNDLIPEEAKKALRSAAGEARRTFIEVSEEVSSRAEQTFSKAAEFAEKAKSDIESRIKAAKDVPPQPEEEAPAPEKAAPKAPVSFENLARMAPFMSREKLSDLILRYGDNADLESIVQIAPFLTRATVQKLIEKSISKKADNQIIRRLAPFAGADALYQLILNNLEAFDWKTLEGLAPFLKRHMVDQLAEYAITGVMPEQPADEPQRAKETIKDAFEGMMGEIGNMVTELGSATRNFFTPKQEETDIPEKPETPVEPKTPYKPETPYEPEMPHEPPMSEQSDSPSDYVLTRRALKDGRWKLVQATINEITDEALLTEIAVKAVSAVAQPDSAAIIMKIAHRLSDEGRQQLFDEIARERAWELAVAVHISANEENARTIIEKAAEAEGADREEACLAIECYAKIAPKDVLEKIIAKAVSEDNWVLLNALADAY